MNFQKYADHDNDDEEDDDDDDDDDDDAERSWPLGNQACMPHCFTNF